MSLRVLALFVFAVLSPGCVPVTEPVGDIDKAEPDKNLIGSWNESDEKKEDLTIDVPAVKGNPKGLMRAVYVGNADDPSNVLWFFTTSIGKHSYANIILNAKGGGVFQQFDKEGEFAKWQKDAAKRYFIYGYSRDGDKLTVDSGDFVAFIKLMETEKIEPIRNEGFYPTPAGWLAKYLGKNDPDAIYRGTSARTYRRLKK